MKRNFIFLLAVGLLVPGGLSLTVPVRAATGSTATPTPENVRFVGAVTCQSSMCHGGASPSRDQFTIWSQEDFHSRAYATLVTARSVRIAEGLGIANATSDVRCTICHAPMSCPGVSLASTASPTEGVSCENCHNAAAYWLRGHTRTDWNYLDRLHAGMRDLRDAYVRAETCVKCHQVIDPALLKAGHPELTFELDGQTASEPRHWMEKADWFGPKAWLVGQAVALREIDSMLTYSNAGDDIAAAQGDAIAWVLANIPGVDASRIDPNYLATGAARSNQLARSISDRAWTPEMTTQALTSLAGTSSSFTDKGVSVADRELRAERLVLGLDRLFKALHGDSPARGSSELSALFDLVQDREHFDAQVFAAQLQKFAAAIGTQK